jgi:hypothetical protein
VTSGDHSFLKATAARSQWCSWTCAASPRSRKPSSQGRNAGAPRVPRGDGRPDTIASKARSSVSRGDGLMVVLQRSHPVPDAADRAVRMSVAMRGRVTQLSEEWHRRGFDLHAGFGVAQDTRRSVASASRAARNYAAIGSVTNLAARLCGEAGAGRFSSASACTARDSRHPGRRTDRRAVAARLLPAHRRMTSRASTLRGCGHEPTRRVRAAA